MDNQKYLNISNSDITIRHKVQGLFRQYFTESTSSVTDYFEHKPLQLDNFFNFLKEKHKIKELIIGQKSIEELANEDEEDGLMRHLVGLYNSKLSAIAIKYNLKQESRKQYNFVFSHELGHALLHKEESQIDYDLNNLTPKWWNSLPLKSKKREQQANTFAYELLMPIDVFFHYAYTNGIDIKQKVFKFSNEGEEQYNFDFINKKNIRDSLRKIKEKCPNLIEKIAELSDHFQVDERRILKRIKYLSREINIS